MDDTTVSVFSEHACHLGEGPTYDPATGAVWWFDILGKRLLEKRWPNGDTLVHDLPEMASALAVAEDGQHAVFTETGICLRDARDGSLKLIAAIEADDRSTRSNDARVHPSGALWGGTMGKKAEKGAGSIYWFFRGEVRRLFPAISIPNSICFTPDGKTAYFADTKTNILYRVACDAATGLPRGEPELFLDHGGKEGGIDGSVVDADGLIWNARWGSGALDCYDSGGTRLRRISIPARQSSCPAFVGPKADRIVVTSAWEGMDESARRADPQAGMAFLVDLPVNGRHEPRIAI